MFLLIESLDDIFLATSSFDVSDEIPSDNKHFATRTVGAVFFLVPLNLLVG